MSHQDEHNAVSAIVLEPDLAKVAEARRFVAAVATRSGFPEDRIFDITVACSEAVANAIEHAPVKGQVRVSTALYQDRLEVRIEGPGEFQAPASQRERGSPRLREPVHRDHRRRVRPSQLRFGRTPGHLPQAPRRDGGVYRQSFASPGGVCRGDGFFGESGLRVLLEGDAVVAETLPQVILDEVIAFSGGALRDDVAILAVSLAPSGLDHGAESAPGVHLS